jgi:hypothetical protein
MCRRCIPGAGLPYALYNYDFWKVKAAQYDKDAYMCAPCSTSGRNGNNKIVKGSRRLLPSVETGECGHGGFLKLHMLVHERRARYLCMQARLGQHDLLLVKNMAAMVCLPHVWLACITKLPMGRRWCGVGPACLQHALEEEETCSTVAYTEHAFLGRGDALRTGEPLAASWPAI